MNSVYVSQQHGCVYAIDGDALIYTPMMTDDSYDVNQDNWDEVDEMSLLGEEQHIRDHIEMVWATLKMREDTPISEAYGG